MGQGGVKRFAVILALALVTIACGNDRDTAQERENTSTDYIIDPATGERSMVIDTPEGRVAMRSGAQVALDLPAGFALPEGAIVTANTIVDQAEGKGVLVTFISSLSPADLAQSYREQAIEAGIALEIDADMNGTRILGGRGPDGTTFSMTANAAAEPKGADDDGTRAQLVVGRGEDY